ncbi:MAG: DMT family transporter [Candidatus Dormibacteraceae bacterium]
MTRRSLLIFIAMSVIWGLPYLFIRIAVSDLSPVVLVFARTAIGALILLPIVLVRGELRGLSMSWLPLLAFAAVEIGVPWVMLASAEQRITSSLAGLLVSAVPLVGVVIATSLGNREHLGTASLSGLMLGVAGVAAIVGFDLGASDWLALAEIGVVVVAYAVGPVIVTRYLARLPSMGVIAVSLAACAVAYAPAAAVQWPRSVPPVDTVVSVAVLAVVCTALAFVLFFALIAAIGPVRATVITYINPAVAAVLGVIVLHEGFTFGMAVGFVLVIAGSVLATRRPRERSAAAALSREGQSSV